LYDGDWAESKWPSTREGYRGWCTACGRHPELTDGASLLQKEHLQKYWSIDPTDERGFMDQLGRYEPTLQEFIKNDNPIAKTYIKGLFNLAHNREFMEFLNEQQHLRKKNQILNFQLLFSKEYNLGA